MAKSSQISKTNQTDTQQYRHVKSLQHPNYIKCILHTLARRTHTIITDKNLKKPLKLHTREDTQQHQ